MWNLEVGLLKGKKVLKEATKAQSKMLSKQKMAQEKSHPTEAVHQEDTKVLHQATEQLDRVRGTIAHHTVEIAHIEALLKNCESTEEESSSPEEGSPLRSGSRDSTAATQQGHDNEHDIEMKDVGNAPNPPQGTATQTDPPPKATEDDLESAVDEDDVKDEWITIEGGGVTPITPADDQLLDLDDQEDQTRAKTPLWSGDLNTLSNEHGFSCIYTCNEWSPWWWPGSLKGAPGSE